MSPRKKAKYQTRSCRQTDYESKVEETSRWLKTNCFKVWWKFFGLTAWWKCLLVDICHFNFQESMVKAEHYWLSSHTHKTVQNLDCCIQFHFLVFLVSILHHFLEEIAWNRPYDAIKSTLNTVWLTSWNWNFVLENSNILLYLASVLARKFKLLIWQVFIQQPFSCIFKVPILKRSVNYLHFIDNLGINFHEVILHLWCGLLLCCNRVWTPDGLTNLVACSTFVRRRLSRRSEADVFNAMSNKIAFKPM